MSKSLVPKKDPGSNVVSAVGNDLVAAAIGGGAVAATLLIPGVGWMLALAGGGYLIYRGAKRGLKNR